MEFHPLPPDVRAALEAGSPAMDAFRKTASEDIALSCRILSRRGCRRIVRAAFAYAQEHGYPNVTLVEKPNVVRETSGLITCEARKIAAEFPDIPLWEANVDAMARIGYLYLRGGTWKGKQIIPSEFVELARHTVDSVVGLPEVDPKRYGNASDHYGLLWWNNADGALEEVPRDAYWSWGLYDSLIVVIPSLDIVVARAGKSWQRKWDGHYDVLKPFLGPIVASVVRDKS